MGQIKEKHRIDSRLIIQSTPPRPSTSHFTHPFFPRSRGVGFARMEKTEICEKVIKDFNNKLLPGCKEALLVKFADSSSRRKKITGAWGAAAAA